MQAKVLTFVLVVCSVWAMGFAPSAASASNFNYRYGVRAAQLVSAELDFAYGTMDDSDLQAVKRIEVILSEQRVIAWEDDRQVFVFPVTTGQEGQPTIPGEYEILDKELDAYSYAWLLKLPLWMGIYQFSEWENGFHALPLDDEGNEYWREAIGNYPASHGCIVLLPEDAETLFNWAEVGTRVIIRE